MTARRSLLLLAGVGLLGVRGAYAQRPVRARRVGWLSSGNSQNPEIVVDVTRAFRALGYREGEVEVVTLFTEGRRDRLEIVAKELVALKPDVIFAGATAGTLAVRRATSTIPIVFAGVADPVGAGFVQSLARPGGNITGISNFGADTASKPLELLREVVPNSRVLGMLASENPGMVPVVNATIAAGRRDGVEVRVERAETLAQLEAAFATFSRQGVQGVVVVSDTPTIVNRQRVAELARQARLPAIYSYAVHVEAGGLMSYGPDPSGLPAQVVGYMDRIFKGARPGDLAVQGPRDFELALNLDAARSLGIVFPPSLLLRANRVVGKH